MNFLKSEEADLDNLNINVSLGDAKAKSNNQCYIEDEPPASLMLSKVGPDLEWANIVESAMKEGGKGGTQKVDSQN